MYWTSESGSRETAFLMRAIWSAGIGVILSKYLATFGKSGVLEFRVWTPSRTR